MRIIPVMALKGGLVVRGVGGRREEYRPVTSTWASEPTPKCMARGLIEQFGFDEVYVADLDAIAGAEPAWPIYRVLGARGLRIWLDAGSGDTRRAGELARFGDGQGVYRIVAGLESLDGPQSLRRVLEAVGRERFVLSLDLRDGAPLAGGSGWQGMSPLQIAEAALAAGARRMIVLDLARVGMGEGAGTEPLCRALRERDGTLELIAGGGVRSEADLESLAAAGCDAALVASALHEGKVKRKR